ncbi:unnamed protein product [Lactuca virosa]|uniref:Actinidain n=1 Tax=Lactuca virosa TaxID=75947 RepID=A0AAU9MII6_9ASTR|nr:unnamed protein product [Lactuca virosa]
MKLLPMVIFLLFALFVVSSAMDMSIIGYDATHMTTSDASSSSWRTDDEVNAMYESWLVKHSKFYNTLREKEKRFQIFKDNLRYIEAHNSGDHSYKLGLNKFSDLTIEEHRLRYSTGAIPKRKSNKLKSDRYSPLSADVLPDSVDWRAKGAVAPVKTQGKCGASWAFSAIGAVEGINQIVTGDLITLSEQQLIDCDTSNYGCDGGFVTDAFDFIIKNGGIQSDKDYPYTAKDGKCDTSKKNTTLVTIDDYEYLLEESELALQKAVANQPISAGIAINSTDFMSYSSGIFSGVCGDLVNHGVVVVGYGTENGKDYWIVRSSWGTEWGEEGYIRLERNIKQDIGKCGITILASYPIKKN